MPVFPLSGLRVALAIAACGLGPVAAHAQPQGAKPVRGWFGSGRTAPGEGHAVSLIGGLFQAIDRRQETTAPHVQLGIRYDRRARGRSWFINAEAARAQFASPAALSSLTHELSAGVATSVGRRTQVRFDQGFRKSPFYTVTFAAPPVDEPPTAALPEPTPAGDYAVFRRPTESLTSAMSVTHLLARHTAATVSYTYERSHALDRRFSAHYVKAGVSHYLGRYAIARAGYGRRSVTPDAGDRMDQDTHDIDLGIDYSRPLSLSRRTRLTMTTGSAIVPAGGGSHQYRFLASASLHHDMGRTWRASLNYGRNLEFVETFAQPLLSDTVSFRVGGRVHRRVDLAVSADLAQGSVGFSAGEAAPNRYDSASATARLGWAMTRLVTGYAEYFVYGHAFGSAVALPAGFGRAQERAELRVGLTFWAPLVR